MANNMKPRIVLNPCRQVFINPDYSKYVCRGRGVVGFGATPQAAYAGWLTEVLRFRLLVR